MKRKGLFAGAGRSAEYDRWSCREIAEKLQRPGLSYGALYSAASYVIRRGHVRRSSVVLEEAARRQARLERAIKRQTRELEKPQPTLWDGGDC